MRVKIFTLAAALVLLGVPLHGALAGETCPPCCTQISEMPCEGSGAACVDLAAASCCEAAPVVPTAPAKRVPDSPGFQWLAATAMGWAPVPTRMAPARAPHSPAPLPSPFRLSVILII